jgi:type IV pilus assembly protein PilB
VRDAIQSGQNSDEISIAAEKNGMKTLKDNCRDLLLSGITTVEEYSQVVYKLD